MMVEIAEMTMTFSGGLVPIPSYPWSPVEIEGMVEMERKTYLEILRDQRKALSKK